MTPPRPDDAVIRDLHRMLDSVRHLLRPVTAADIRERLLHQASRLRALSMRTQPAPPPLLTQPRALPRPLNPLYFVHAKRGQGSGTNNAAP